MRKLIERTLGKTGMDFDIAEFFSWFIVFVVFVVAMVSFFVGVWNANDKDWCVVKSISDVLKSPPYAAGCVLGKDRFEVRLN